MNAISPYVLRHCSAHREGFQSEHPLTNFNVIPNFLRREVLREVVVACQNGRYKTFCGYSHAKTSEVRSEFCEPNEQDTYVTVHERPTRPIKALVRLYELFKKKETIAALSDLTGIALDKVGLDVLTSWQPGAFLESHTDYEAGADAKLIVSLSLARGWRPVYGGATVYAWEGFNRAVRVIPRCNTAVLFVPFSGSFHWVEQVSNNAPPRRRFTWTVFFS